MNKCRFGPNELLKEGKESSNKRNAPSGREVAWTLPKGRVVVFS
jgi:hypothetical protein